MHFQFSSSGKRQIGSNALARYVGGDSLGYPIRSIAIARFVSVLQARQHDPATQCARLPACRRFVLCIYLSMLFSDLTHIHSQLYRSSSFNSSGRSSNCDNTEDMYSDVSLEDVQDINLKVSQSYGDH